ncbi:hypothetical protein HK101_008857, partial [Irineochytrium annulatum]
MDGAASLSMAPGIAMDDLERTLQILRIKRKKLEMETLRAELEYIGGRETSMMVELELANLLGPDPGPYGSNGGVAARDGGPRSMAIVPRTGMINRGAGALDARTISFEIERIRKQKASMRGELLRQEFLASQDASFTFNHQQQPTPPMPMPDMFRFATPPMMTTSGLGGSMMYMDYSNSPPSSSTSTSVSPPLQHLRHIGLPVNAEYIASPQMRVCEPRPFVRVDQPATTEDDDGEDEDGGSTGSEATTTTTTRPIAQAHGRPRTTTTTLTSTKEAPPTTTGSSPPTAIVAKTLVGGTAATGKRKTKVEQEQECRCKVCGAITSTVNLLGFASDFEKPYACDLVCEPCHGRGHGAGAGGMQLGGE